MQSVKEYIWCKREGSWASFDKMYNCKIQLALCFRAIFSNGDDNWLFVIHFGCVWLLPFVGLCTFKLQISPCRNSSAWSWCWQWLYYGWHIEERRTTRGATLMLPLWVFFFGIKSIVIFTLFLGIKWKMTPSLVALSECFCALVLARATYIFCHFNLGGTSSRPILFTFYISCFRLHHWIYHS